MSFIDPDGELCEVNDVVTANRIFGKTYTIQDCGSYSECTRHARHVNPYSGDFIDVVYCETNMTKLGPILVFFIMVILCFITFIYIKIRNNDKTKSSHSNPYDDTMSTFSDDSF